MSFKRLIAPIILVFAMASVAAAFARQSTKGVATGSRETLLSATQSWNGTRYSHYPAGQPQLTTIRLTLAPHTVLPWHTHPFPNSVYVLSGTLTLRDRDDGKTLVVREGQAVGESVNVVHRGESGDEPTVLLITYAGTPGIPTSIPAKGEMPEY